MHIVIDPHPTLSAEIASRAVRRVFFFLLLLIVLPGALTAQPVVPGEGPRAPGTTGDMVQYDTSGARVARERTIESASLLESPVDPAQYKLGPGDQLTIAIPSSDFRMFDLTVSPDAKIIIPRVGEVDLRGRTLADGSKLIVDRIGRVFKASDVAVSLKKIRQFKVSLIGAVIRPGTVTATPATRVSEVIDLGGGVMTTASKRSVLLRRNGKAMEVDLLPYYAYGDLNANPYVEGGDVIQVGVQDKKSVVAIYGAVQRPGEFPFRRGDSISSLIRYSWGFAADAVPDSILVVSVNEHGDTLAHSFVRATPDGSVVPDRELAAGDRVFVRHITDYRQTEDVVVAGEVLYPGTYPIEPGRTRLRDLILSAGGFTSDASIPDAVLIRRKVLQEKDTRYELIQQINPEKRSPEDISYLRIKQTERPGVMTVDIPKLLAGNESENIILTDEDSLYVPAQKDFIKVTGKVKNPGNVRFRAGAGYEHYLQIAGGYGWRADQSATRVIKGKTGDTFPASSESNYTLEPGDQIFVPEESESNFWAGVASVITVVAQLGTIVAVILSVQASLKSK
ncbi:MAG: SLBB domain-containing protein [Bacteroidetes bacterium]|nr:SLBB domain-containing protein [Bacteroidota bacterium]